MRLRRAVGAGVVLATLAAGAAQAATPELSVDQRLRGPAGGRGRDAGAGARVPGRPVLRERLAHHGRDGRHRHAAAEAARLGLVPRQRHVGRARDGVHERARGTCATRSRRVDGIELERTDVAPDGRRGALLGLKLTNPKKNARTVNVFVDAHSELMTQYPWGFGGACPTRATTRRTRGAFDGRQARLPRHGDVAGRGASRTPTRRSSARTARRATARPGRATTAPFGAGRACCAADTQRRCRPSATTGRSAAAPAGSCTTSVRVPGGGSATAVGRRGRLGELARRGALRARRADRGPGGAARAQARQAREARELDAARPAGRPRSSPTRSSGASRTCATSRRSPRTSTCAGPNEGKVWDAGGLRWTACAGSAPASPTTRGCSASTASTRRTRR